MPSTSKTQRETDSFYSERCSYKSAIFWHASLRYYWLSSLSSTYTSLLPTKLLLKTWTRRASPIEAHTTLEASITSTKYSAQTSGYGHSQCSVVVENPWVMASTGRQMCSRAILTATSKTLSLTIPQIMEVLWARIRTLQIRAPLEPLELMFSRHLVSFKHRDHTSRVSEERVLFMDNSRLMTKTTFQVRQN